MWETKRVFREFAVLQSQSVHKIKTHRNNQKAALQRVTVVGPNVT